MLVAILRRELLGGGRHGRLYAVRGGYLALLAFVTVPALLWQVDRMRSAYAFSATRVGQDFVIPFGIIQFLLVTLVAPALAMSAVQSERANGSLELLHAAGVRPVEVIAGKFASRMLWLLLFIGSGLPLFMAGTIMGGVGLEVAALLVAHSVMAAALGTAIGFTFSAVFRQTVPAMVLSYLVLALVYLAPPMALVVYDEASGTHVPDEWYAMSCPLPAVVLSAVAALGNKWAPWVSVLPQAMLAAAFLVPALLLCRPGESRPVGSAPARLPVRGAPGDADERPRVRGNPVAWRDARSARRGLSARILRAAYLVCGALVVVTALVAKAWSGGKDDDFGKIAVYLLVAAGGLVALVVGSGSISEERERRSLPLLRLSRLSAPEILVGKLWGLFVYLWPLMLLPLLVSALFFSEAAVWTALVGVTTGTFLFSGAAIGVGFSAFTRRSAVSVGLAVGLSIVYMIVVPMLVKFLDIDFLEDLIWCFDPIFTLLGIVDQLGRPLDDSYYGLAQRSFPLSVIGLCFLLACGACGLCASLAGLARPEEGGS